MDVLAIPFYEEVPEELSVEAVLVGKTDDVPDSIESSCLVDLSATPELILILRM